jgi:hypothetical protein
MAKFGISIERSYQHVPGQEMDILKKYLRDNKIRPLQQITEFFTQACCIFHGEANFYVHMSVLETSY